MLAFLWRVFLIALVIWLLYRLVFTWLRKPRAEAGADNNAKNETVRNLHEMVQDEVCKVYLPRNQALMLKGEDGREHFFCSVECKNKFQEQRNGQDGTRH